MLRGASALNVQALADPEFSQQSALARRPVSRGMLPVAAFVLSISAGQAGATGIAGSSYSVGLWEGAAYANRETGAFYNCEASVGYINGDSILYSIDAEGQQYIGISSADLNTGQNAPTAIAIVTVDSKQPRQIVTLRALPGFYLLDITGDRVMLDQFKAGRNLRIELNGKVLDYDLQDSARAVDLTRDCVETQRRAMRAELAPQPSPEAAPAPTADVATAAPAAMKGQPAPAVEALAPPADGFFPGEIVEVTVDGTNWVRGTVTTVARKGTEVEVHAAGNNGIARRIAIAAGNIRKMTAPPAPAPAPPLAAAPAFAVGDQVEILYSGRWFPGAIKEVRADGTWRISYDGYDSNWDENVSANRLRARDSTDNRIAAAATAREVAETFPWPAHPPGYKAGLGGAYYSHTTSFFNNVLQIYPSMYFLTDNGRFAHSPPEGFSFSDFDSRDIALEGEGIYWIEGDEVIFRYADESRNRDGQSFGGAHDTGRLVRVLGNAATPVKGFTPGTRIDGSCGGGASIGGGTSSATSLILNANGTYRWGSSVSFAVTGGDVERADGSMVQYETSGGSSGTNTGRYEFDGYSLIFISDQGTTSVATVAAYGDDLANGLTEFLYMNGSIMSCS